MAQYTGLAGDLWLSARIALYTRKFGKFIGIIAASVDQGRSKIHPQHYYWYNADYAYGGRIKNHHLITMILYVNFFKFFFLSYWFGVDVNIQGPARPFNYNWQIRPKSLYVEY